MGHQVAGDVGEAGVDVLPHVLQLLVLVLRDLEGHPDHKVGVSLCHVLDQVLFKVTFNLGVNSHRSDLLSYNLSLSEVNLSQNQMSVFEGERMENGNHGDACTLSLFSRKVIPPSCP